MYFKLESKPVAKMRARHVHRNGYVMTYDPQKDLVNRDKLWFMNEMNKNSFLKLSIDPIKVEMRLGITPSKKMKQRALKEEFAITKPDLDNYIKYYLDVMNKIVYEDDNSVSVIVASKIYTLNPFVEINVTLCENSG